MGYRATPLSVRLLNMVIPEPNSGCWLWIGSLKKGGYGQIGGFNKSGKRTMLSAHKASYLAFNGDVPDGLIVRHTCDNRICVNPDHLVVGTQKDNFNDMVERGRAYWGHQTHCKNGHEFTPENTRIRPEGSRRCIICARLGSKRHYRKHINANPRTDRKT